MHSHSNSRTIENIFSPQQCRLNFCPVSSLDPAVYFCSCCLSCGLKEMIYSLFYKSSCTHPAAACLPSGYRIDMQSQKRTCGAISYLK